MYVICLKNLVEIDFIEITKFIIIKIGGSQFWSNLPHYTNINWNHLDEENIPGMDVRNSWSISQYLYVGLEFENKDAVKNAVKQNALRMRQSFYVVESKKTRWVWGGRHTCLNTSLSQDHDKLDSELIASFIQGTLLIATTQDGNVKGETLLAWSWFFSHLRLHVTNKKGICLISDRHRSIKSVIDNEALVERWIGGISKEKWSMTYDADGRRYGHMTTNLSKCVNKVLKDCRNLPITALVRSTYTRCTEYFSNRGSRALADVSSGKVFVSKLVEALQKN
uniref:Uncharacterized protein n=1 Tax=Cajanus cajan TaxID=3821 RepID=A0A151SAH5_CAJCA|nr:hypothetical protein KK1_026301 [Cajanus cajan]